MVRLPQYQRETGRTVVPMTRSRAGELLRKPEQPPRASFLELFFDLVFVFAFTRVSQQLLAALTSHRRALLTDTGKTLLLLMALLMVWFATAWITDLYDAGRPEIQLVVTGSMFGSLLMAVALPRAFGSGGLVFATTYVAIHIGRGLVLVPALRGHEAQRRAAGVLLWFAVSAVPWIVGAILHGSLRGALWTVAIAIDYAAGMLLYPAPWTGPTRSAWPVVAEYLSERYRQLFIIALGELILVVGVDHTNKHDGTIGGHSAAFVVLFANTVLLWRIYTYRAGELLPDAIGAASNPGRTVRRALIAHLLMLVGVIANSAGYGLVIEHPVGHTEPVWVAAILGGPALFIVGRAAFERVVFNRVSRDRVIGLLVLVAVAPVMPFVTPLAVATTAVAVLAGIVIADAARVRGRPSNLQSVRAGGPS
jgi:low temperature requirement protein LtrA